MNENNKIGDRYFYGDGVEQNYETAFSYYLKAAELNDPEGCYHVAWCYEHGLGTMQAENDGVDLGLALMYYRKAADAGYVEAMHQMAILRYFGLNGVEENKLEAISWEKKAYQEGVEGDTYEFFGALLMLGLSSESTEQDYCRGKELIAKACIEGSTTAAELNHCIEVIERAFGKVTPDLLENLLYLVYVVEHHQDYERDDKEILVEAQAPRIINMALDGDYNACIGLREVFFPQSKVNEELKEEKIASFDLSVKWAEMAYKCDPVRGADYYITELALVGHISYKIGAFDDAEKRLTKVSELLDEARTIPGYHGDAYDPAKCADYYTRLGFSQVETGNLNGAYNSFMKANQQKVTSDALYGLFKVYRTEEFQYFDWQKASCIV